MLRKFPDMKEDIIQMKMCVIDYHKKEYDFIENKVEITFFTEMLEGDLENPKVLKILRAMPELDRLRLFKHFVETVREIHSRNFMIGDIKPANIMVRYDPIEKITIKGVEYPKIS